MEDWEREDAPYRELIPLWGIAVVYDAPLPPGYDYHHRIGPFYDYYASDYVLATIAGQTHYDLPIHTAHEWPNFPILAPGHYGGKRVIRAIRVTWTD